MNGPRLPNTLDSNRIWIYRDAGGTVELWTSLGKGLDQKPLWFLYIEKTPKGYADAMARITNEKPDYKPCWWGMGGESPEDRGREFVGTLEKNMIETDETGQKQIDAIFKKLHNGDWSEWEEGFITNLEGKKYKNLSPREKSIVTDLYKKL